MIEEFVTRDLWCAAAVSLQLKVNPTLRNDNGVILFCFKSDDDLRSAINNYYSGGALSCAGYAEAVKSLKSQMYSAKGQV